MSGNPRMLIVFTLAAAIVVGAIVALATGYWWAIGIALAAHFTGTFFVIRVIFNRVDQADKPDPLSEVRLEDERAVKHDRGLAT